MIIRVIRGSLPRFRLGVVALGLFLMTAAPVPAVEVPKSRILEFDAPAAWFFGEVEVVEEGIAGVRGRLDAHGVDPFLLYWGDFLANPVGGESQVASWVQLLVVGVDVDLGKSVSWDGARLHVSATDVAGSNLSLDVGNVFTISQAYLMNTFAFYACYLEQKVFDDKLTLRLGRMAPGEAFATLPAFALPVSGAVNGNPTSLFLNSPFTATGSATWAAFAKFQPTPTIYVDSGIYQATSRLGNPAYHGLDFSVRDGDGILLMTETGWTPTFGAEASQGKSTVSGRGYPAIYTLGAYYSHFAFETFSGDSAQDAFGFYALGQQTVWRHDANANNTLVAWGGLTWSPQTDLAMMPLMGFAGLSLQAPIAQRPNDSLLAAVYTGTFSRDYAAAQRAAGAGNPTAETVIELSYLVQITENFQFQPDVQWVNQPGGRTEIPDAFIVGAQFSASF